MIIFKVIFIILINSNIVKCQQSCSYLANYFSDYNGIYGRVEIPHVPLQTITLFEIELSVAARLPSVSTSLVGIKTLSNFYLIIG